MRLCLCAVRKGSPSSFTHFCFGQTPQRGHLIEINCWFAIFLTASPPLVPAFRLGRRAGERGYRLPHLFASRMNRLQCNLPPSLASAAPPLPRLPHARIRG